MWALLICTHLRSEEGRWGYRARGVFSSVCYFYGQVGYARVPVALEDTPHCSHHHSIWGMNGTGVSLWWNLELLRPCRCLDAACSYQLGSALPDFEAPSQCRSGEMHVLRTMFKVDLDSISLSYLRDKIDAPKLGTTPRITPRYVRRLAIASLSINSIPTP